MGFYSGTFSRMTDDMPAPEPLATIVKERDAALTLLAEIHNAFCCGADGWHYAVLGGVMYDRIQKAIGAHKPTIVGINASPSS